MSDLVFFIEVAAVLCVRPKAIRILIDREDGIVIELLDGERKHWIPKSQIVESSEVKDWNDSGMLHITQWLAEQMGIW